jgi:RNA polymerase sigma-70 factor (ECF subfamily)
MVLGMSDSAPEDSMDREWSALMRAAQDGDQQAYARLLRAILPHVRGLVRRRVFAGAEAEIEDIVQEVLLSLHLVRHTYDPGRPFRPWLAGIVRHRLLDSARRHYRRFRHEIAVETLPETSAQSAANSGQDESDEIAALRQAMAALSPGQRQAFELLKLRGLSLKQAAAETGMSVAALKVAAHRAYKSLKVAFGRDKA